MENVIKWHWAQKVSRPYPIGSAASVLMVTPQEFHQGLWCEESPTGKHCCLSHHFSASKLILFFFHFTLNTCRQRNECKVPMGCRPPLMTYHPLRHNVDVSKLDTRTARDIGPQQIGLPHYAYASSGKNNNIQHVMFNSLVFIKQLQLQQTTLRRG